MRWPTLITTLLLAAALAGCASTRETQPPRTANEELLLSKAVDEATDQIDPTVASDSNVFVDEADFKTESDRHYAISAINDRLLERGYHLVPSRSEADTIVAIRSGALSINKASQLWFGIPSVTVPVPLAGPLETPGLDLFRTIDRTGVAKLGLSFYDAQTGELQDTIGPVYGFSHLNRRKILMVSWTESTLLPAEAAEQAESTEP
ncbi:hypothetical protein SADO_02215 [Salinisphaera dokdonensis CL-ES53]|uniref:Uncharacterized protein n=1 Tax=Salinisphaera dokdonensis CL-ES53 TaxID=1304272 RepID=A0ABV2AXN9_9GAMM